MWQEWDKLKKEEEPQAPAANCLHVVILLGALLSTKAGKVLQSPFGSLLLPCILAMPNGQ